MGKICRKKEKKGRGRTRKKVSKDTDSSDSDYHHTSGEDSGSTCHEPVTNFHEHKFIETRRYGTRSSKSLLAQCTLRSPQSLRSPIRNVNGIASPSSSLAPPKINLFETTPSSQNFNLVVPPEPQVSSFAVSLSNPKQKDHCLSPAKSLGFTDFAETLVDDSQDPDEVDSILDSALVKVDGYIVKKENAALLKRILDKQGNIAKNCVFETTINRSYLLDKICDVNSNLEKKLDQKTIKICDVESMMVEVRDFEKAGLNVKWLKERLYEIVEVLEESKTYFVIKQEVKKNNECANRKRKELEGLKEKTRVAENELAAIESRGTELIERMTGTKDKCKDLWTKLG